MTVVAYAEPAKRTKAVPLIDTLARSLTATDVEIAALVSSSASTEAAWIALGEVFRPLLAPTRTDDGGYQFPSKSSPGAEYVARVLSPGYVVCDCPGYVRNQTCKHVDAVKGELAHEEVPVTLEALIEAEDSTGVLEAMVHALGDETLADAIAASPVTATIAAGKAARAAVTAAVQTCVDHPGPVPATWVERLGDLYVALLEAQWAYLDAAGIADMHVTAVTRLVGEIGMGEDEAVEAEWGAYDAAVGFGTESEARDAGRLFVRQAVALRWDW